MQVVYFLSTEVKVMPHSYVQFLPLVFSLLRVASVLQGTGHIDTLSRQYGWSLSSENVHFGTVRTFFIVLPMLCRPVIDQIPTWDTRVCMHPQKLVSALVASNTTTPVILITYWVDLIEKQKREWGYCVHPGLYQYNVDFNLPRFSLWKKISNNNNIIKS